jgi:protein gp37
LGPLDISLYLAGVEHVTVGGEMGRAARLNDYDWVLSLREQCATANVTFWFKSTGSLFRRDGVEQKLSPFKQSSLAKELSIDISGGKRLF